MLFDYGDNITESDKERNLYYKFFAGYYFNEFVPGYEQRVEAFCSLLNSRGEEYINYIPEKPIRLSVPHTHVTFDMHAYLLHNNTDRGELADVFIYDRLNRIALAIEVKFFTDWNIQKDIQGNADRIKGITDQDTQIKFVQCLLVTSEKWKNVKRLKNRSNSSYSALHKRPNISLIILTWEKLIETCEHETIKNYFYFQTNRLKKDFRIY